MGRHKPLKGLPGETTLRKHVFYDLLPEALQPMVHSKKNSWCRLSLIYLLLGKWKRRVPFVFGLSLDTVFCRILVLPSLTWDRWYWRRMEWNACPESNLYTELASRYYFPFKVYSRFFSEFNLGTNILFYHHHIYPTWPWRGWWHPDTDKQICHHSAIWWGWLPCAHIWNVVFAGRVNYAAGLSTRFYAQKGSVGQFRIAP